MSHLIIGAPVLNMYGTLGYVSAIKAAEGRQFTLGTGRMASVLSEVEICYPDRIANTPDNIVIPWLRNAAASGYEPISPDRIPALREAAQNAQATTREIARLDRAETVSRETAFRIEAATRLPGWAKSVIVAEYHRDDSDSMTDYFNHKTERTVILGFSPHTRDLFPELRKFAAGFADTADLSTAPEKAEHRQKYSMGRGYFLKDGSTHSTGWCVQKRKLYRGADSIPVGEWVPAPVDPAPLPPATPSASPISGATIEKHQHSKHGFDMHIVILADRVERDAFDSMLATAKQSGGWYTRKWGTTPAGFAFKREDAAKAFAASVGAVDTPAPVAGAVYAGNAEGGTATALRAAADRLQAEIDSKFADRQTNTPKRQRQAASARQDGTRLQRTQQAMRALAEHYDAGTVPAALRGITTKAALYGLARSFIDTSRSGYYDAGHDTGQPATETPATLALWALLSEPDPERAKADALRDRLERLHFADIPGYFPTPAEIVERMIEAADIPNWASAGAGCRILEPSAGSGAILDAIKKEYGNALIHAYEVNCTLREILTAKGYNLIGSDFMEDGPARLYDRVLMNPPFEKWQDIAHILRAVSQLRPGGRLVAICANGPRQREQLQPLCSSWQDLPAGTFKEAGTGVATALIVIDA